MSKKRTRAQKIRSQQKNIPLYNIDFPNENKHVEPDVKGQFAKKKTSVAPDKTNVNSSEQTAENDNLKLNKSDIFKSLAVASFILCLIEVIYLLWYR